nr:MAG TPA: hypothetical protein [Caudoviricetes sp.]
MHSVFCIKKGHSTGLHRPYAISLSLYSTLL